MSTLQHNKHLAISTGSFWPLTTKESIELLHKIQLKEIELTLQQHEFYLSFDRKLKMPLLDTLIEMVNSHQLIVRSVHAPHMDAEHGHSTVAKIEYLIQSLKICHLLGGKVLVIHPFHIFNSYEETIYYLKGYEKNIKKVLLSRIDKLFDFAQKSDIVISMENIKVWEDDETKFLNIPNNMSRLINDINSKDFCVTLDIIHAQLENNLQEFINTLKHSIVNIHIADLTNSEKRVPLGEGIIEWEKLIPIIKRIPKLHHITLELKNATYSDIKRSVKVIKKHWNKT